MAEATKARRQFRRKTEGDDEKGEDTGAVGITTPFRRRTGGRGSRRISGTPASTRDGPRGVSIGSGSGRLLSFEDEMEEETTPFKVKKSSVSTPSDGTTGVKTPPPHLRTDTYTPEVLQELHRSTFKFRPSSPTRNTPTAASTSQDQAPWIPDAAEINAARRRREQIRDFGEYVPFPSATSDEDVEEGKVSKYGETRLVEEDVERDEEEEVFDGDAGHRITFGDPGKDESKQRARREAARWRREKEEEEEDGVEGTEEPDEVAQWEAEQARRGVRATAPARGSTGVAMMPAEGGSATVSSEGYQHDAVPESVSVDEVQAHLRDVLATMKDTIDRDEEVLTQLQESLAKSEEAVESCTNDMKDATERYTFFQETRSFVSDVLDCLDEKMKYVEATEDGIYQTWRETGKARWNQFCLDLHDALEDAGLDPGTWAILDDDNATSTNGPNDPDQEDEYGRDLSHHKVTRRDERTRSRMAREAQRAEARCRLKRTDEEGWSSDEGESDELRYQAKEREILAAKGNTVMDDVVMEYRSLRTIKKRFEDWKFLFPATYKSAFVSISLPTVFTPLVRLQLFGWDPLQRPVLEGMDWHDVLFNYGIAPGANANLEDPDTDLVPNLVNKLVAQKAADIIAEVWCPFSSSQSTQVERLVEVLLGYVGHLEAPTGLQELFASILSRLRYAVDVYDVPILPPDASPKAISVTRRCFVKGLKLLRVIGLFAKYPKYVPRAQLQGMAMDDLAAHKMHSHLRMNCLTIESLINDLEKILECLPLNWRTSTPTVHLYLVPLRDLLMERLADPTTTFQDIHVERAVSVLEKLHDVDGARELQRRR